MVTETWESFHRVDLGDLSTLESSCDGSLLELPLARKNHMNQGENHNMTSDTVSKDKTLKAGHD